MPTLALVGGRGSGKTRFFQYATNSLSHDGPFQPSTSWLLAPAHGAPHLWLMDTGTEPFPTHCISAYLMFDMNWSPPENSTLPILTWSGDNQETFERILTHFHNTQ
jgi:hypothetical protein